MWVKVDDRLPSSRKVLRIPRAARKGAMGLWVMTAAWSSRDGTDGWVPGYVIEEHACDLEDAEALVAAGLWEHDDRDGEEGYQFVKWAEYQPTQSEIDERRRIERERKAEQRRNKSGKFAGQDESHGRPTGVPRENRGTPRESHASPTVPGPSRPDPTPSPSESDATTRPFPLPESWTPTEAHRALAAERGVDCDLEAVKMRDWATAEGKKGKDWDARFRNWLRSARPDRQQHRSNRDADSRDALVQAHFDMEAMHQ